MIIFIFLFHANLPIASNPNGVFGANTIVKLHSFESVIEFELNVDRLGEARNPPCVQSSEFELNDIRWKIQVCRVGENSDEIKHVDMSLVYLWDEESAAWSCEANATFKLLARDKGEPVVQSFESYNFNKDEPVQTIQDFVVWKNFTEKYVNGEHATFEITISTKTPNRAAKLDESFAKFDVRIKNANRLGFEYSNELIVRGIRWKILTMKINEHLGIFLFANGDDMGIDVSWKASATIHLLSPTTTNVVSRSFSDISFNWTNLNYGFFKFIEWNDFINVNKKFIEKGKAIIKVELSVSEPIKSA